MTNSDEDASYQYDNDPSAIQETHEHPIAETADKGKLFKKLTVLAIVLVVAGVIYVQVGDQLTLENLAQQESQLREYQQNQPVLVYGLAFLIYAAVTGLSLPGAAVLSLVFAWYFGFISGFFLVSFASTTGATLAFMLSRYLLRDLVESRFGQRLSAFNENLKKEGAFYLFSLRLIPAVPFFVINIVMGLTPMKVRTFWWVSQLGMIPGTMVFVYAGSSVPDLNTLAEKGANGILSPQLLAALILLGLFPLTIKKAMGYLRPAPRD